MTIPVTKEEFLLIFQDQLNVIQGLKDKAWKATNYSVLGQAAVYALYHANNSPSCSFTFWMTVLSGVVALWASALVNNLQGGICERRNTTEYLLTIDSSGKGTLTFQEVWKAIKKEKKKSKIERPIWWKFCKRWISDWPIFLAYVMAIFGPLLVVIGLMWQGYS